MTEQQTARDILRFNKNRSHSAKVMMKRRERLLRKIVEPLRMFDRTTQQKEMRE